MFYCYVLKSKKTGRRYVGSCESLESRINRHNSGNVPATKHGIPWIILHAEEFPNRPDALARERFYKMGRGRDELDRFEGRSPRRLTPTKLT